MSLSQRLKRLERFRTAGDQVIINLRIGMPPDEAVVAVRAGGRRFHRRPDETLDALCQRAIERCTGQGVILIDYLSREQVRSEHAPGEPACGD